MDSIHGITLETLAEIASKQGELRAKHGEAQGRLELTAFLASKSLTENDWALANNAWLERFNADPTGKLQAQYHQLMSQLTTKAHFGDVRDMSQDVAGGVTLEKYAQIMAEISKPGADGDGVARAHGLTNAEAWATVNNAWAVKMREDTTFKLATQYGALYNKFNPEAAQRMLDQTAALLAESNKPRDRVDQPAKDLSQATLLRQLRSTSRNERWEAARWLAHQWKKSDPSTQVNLECVPVLIDILEHHDDHTVSNAGDAAEKLTRDLELRTDDVKFAVKTCLNGAREKLGTLEAAFAPIKDQAVPERVTLQTRIDEYKSLIKTLEKTSARLAEPVKAPSASTTSTRASAPQPPVARGVPKGLLAVPVVIAIAAAAIWKAMSGAPAPSAASASAPSAVLAEPKPESHAAAKPAAPARPKGH